eukprot:scaffold1134_cov295-Prasinococcus_capsulatus_cf.AAC.4
MSVRTCAPSSDERRDASGLVRPPGGPLACACRAASWLAGLPRSSWHAGCPRRLGACGARAAARRSAPLGVVAGSRAAPAPLSAPCLLRAAT